MDRFLYDNDLRHERIKTSGNLALKFKRWPSNFNGTVKFILSLYLDLYSLNYRVHYLTQQKLLGNNFPLELKKRL